MTLGARLVAVLRGEPILLAAVLCGVGLRGYQITGQIAADDEWHALHAAHLWSYAEIASHFGEADYSIPVTLFYKALAATVGLSEMTMRAPMLVSGVAAILVLPLLAREWIGRPASDVFAWLLAIAPLHVYFSRYARPYSVTMLLAVVAVFAFFRWLLGGSRRWSWVYAAGAVGASYFHVVVLPIVLAPLFFGLADGALRRGARRRSPAELLGVGGVVAVGLAVLLTLPLVVDFASLTGKAARSAVQWPTVKGAAQLFAGTGHLWLLATMAGLAGIGGVCLARRQPRLAAYLALLALCQIAAPVVTGPAGIATPIVLARYCLPLLPLLLLVAAIGIVRLDAAAARRLAAYPAGALAAVAVALLLVFGPLPAVYYYPNNWTNHRVFQYRYGSSGTDADARPAPPEVVSPFYERLAALPAGSLLVVEAPWYYAWHENAYPYYQMVHRQRMQVGFVGGPDRFIRGGDLPRSSGIRLRNAVHVGDAAALQRRQVRYVIFHKSLHLEIVPATPPIIDVSDWIRQYGLAYGAPVYQDPDIVVFDVGGAS